jgi:hypothetical protein
MDSYWRKTVLAERPGVVGYFCVGDSAVRSNPRFGRGCTWATLAAHALADLLAAADRHGGHLTLPPPPPGVVTADVCEVTGLRPAASCPHKREHFGAGGVPDQRCAGHGLAARTP